jgi:hypothetical protein
MRFTVLDANLRSHAGDRAISSLDLRVKKKNRRYSSSKSSRAHHGDSSATPRAEHSRFTFQIIVWLWSPLFANFAEAVAEGRGRAGGARPQGATETTGCGSLR